MRNRPRQEVRLAPCAPRRFRPAPTKRCGCCRPCWACWPAPTRPGSPPRLPPRPCTYWSNPTRSGPRCGAPVPGRVRRPGRAPGGRAAHLPELAGALHPGHPGPGRRAHRRAGAGPGAPGPAGRAGRGLCAYQVRPGPGSPGPRSRESWATVLRWPAVERSGSDGAWKCISTWSPHGLHMVAMRLVFTGGDLAFTGGDVVCVSKDRSLDYTIITPPRMQAGDERVSNAPGAEA